MKTIASLIIILFIGVSVQSQTVSDHVSIKTIKVNFPTAQKNKNVTLNSATRVARLYKNKNSNVKKALSFAIRKNKTKMA